ncbi:ferritin-like domain-containing protein [Halolamina sp. CBA1230]|uniref:ferritin-like domain-containing protein n=1 Tax=Halolamina sp. CBA1230 TaxID=1853690 RepID=UPI0009A23F9A|nr:ferritin-like domain-containing protein [Halolamina sp. CBA1230]QKY20152.1 ferritin-like domain-containing protein [Halolamina sp. CBA1230]
MTDRDDTGSTDGQSRRNFLTTSAVAGGALLSLGGATGVALADTEQAFDDVEGTDVDVLNYALSLEQFESAFYETALETFDEAAFDDSDAVELYDAETVYGYVETLADHEAEHVEVLTEAVELLGGEPAEPAEYEFGFEEVGEFFSLAAVIENAGVAAYAGAAPFVESPDLLAVALSIHSVEARHAALANQLAGTSPFPDAFDGASSQSDVLDTVGQFVADEENGDETDTPEDGTETPDGNETDTPADNGTDTPADNGTDTPAGNETTPDGPGNETATPNDTAGNETAPNGD